MQNQRRGGGRGGATETKAPNKVREADLNKDRLAFVLTSLVGQRVTAKLRGDVMYEGLFHSFSYENDYAITLKSARKLASEMSKSGKVMDALIIPGKDFLQVSALDVPSPSALEKENTPNAAGFKTDGEISKGISSERELVPWAGGPGEGGDLDDHSGLVRDGTSWDQFERNEQMFGVSTTFNEELYTTKLDPNSIPHAKRMEAERLAKEIENGVMASEMDAKVDGEDDEEGRFSAVTGTGAYQKGNWQAGGAAPSAKARGGKNGGDRPPPERTTSGPAALAQIPQMPEDRLRQDDLGGLDPRGKGRNLGANSPSMMKTSMISEMKRINALNLEPAVPKLEDKTGSDWINFQQQTRNAQKAAGANGLKMEFQQSLDLIHKREASKLQQKQMQQEQQQAQANSSSDNWRGGKGGNQIALPPEALQQGMMQQRGGQMQMGGGGGDSTRSKTFQFNPNAKDFSFNPGATSFTPSNAGGGGGGGGGPPPSMMPGNPGGMTPSGAPGTQMQAPSKPAIPSPPFNMFAVNNQLLTKKLDDILDCFHDSSKNEDLPRLDPNWPEAQGPSYHDVLGQPNPANPLPPVGNMNAQPMGAPWQQQQQQQQQQPMGQAPPGAPQGQGQAPQMMPQQNFMVAQPGQNNQMYQPMYQGPGGQMPQGQRPQNPGNMPPQEQQQQQMPQFNQQNMMQQPPGPGQGMAVPSGMVPQGGPQGGQGGQMMMMPGGAMPGGAMPKFGVQMMMVPTGPGGQYPQGFPPQQGQPGQPGPQPGGPPGGPQPAGHWQQAHMMVPGGVHNMQQVGPRGPPHQMGGHEG